MRPSFLIKFTAGVSLFVSLTFSVAANAAEAVRVYSAGSLVGPLKEAISASGIAATPTFGPAGLLRQRLQGGEAADLYLSADLAQPRTLVEAGKATGVIAFARNKLCTLSRDALGVTDANVLDKMLDPAVRLATSTPKADPGGDYAWLVFDKADALKSGSQKILEDKALKLIGSPNTMTPIAGKSASATVFLSDKADILIYYCSGQAETLRDVPGLVSRPLPPALDITAVYGLTLLGDNPDAQRLALFLLSEQGQTILVKSGLMPVLGD